MATTAQEMASVSPRYEHATETAWAMDVAISAYVHLDKYREAVGSEDTLTIDMTFVVPSLRGLCREAHTVAAVKHGYAPQNIKFKP